MINACEITKEEIRKRELEIIKGNISPYYSIGFGGCPDCGDSLQKVKVHVPDHGKNYAIYLAWCMDCKDIKGFAKFKDGE